MPVTPPSRFLANMTRPKGFGPIYRKPAERVLFFACVMADGQSGRMAT
jgi:hypothetical protein